MAKITEELLEKLKFKKRKSSKWEIESHAPDGVKSGYDWSRTTRKEILGFEYMSQFSWDVKNGNWIVFVGEGQHEIKNAETLEEIINLNDRLEVLIKGKNIKR